MRSSPSQGTRSAGLQLGLITDAAVVAYGAFTIAANAVVIAGGTISTLAVVTFALLGVLALGVVVARKRGWAQAYTADLLVEPAAAPRVFTARSVAPPLVLGALGLLGWLFTRNPWVAWLGVALASVAAAVAAQVPPLAASGSESAPEATGDRLARIVLHASAVACALFTLLANRPRSDDTLYLHLAVAAADYPQQALLSVQTLHGPPSVSYTHLTLPTILRV